jgi:hypothetical protein
MSRREKLGVVSTAFGAVNRPVLEALQDSFDTQQLLELVDQLDKLRSRICDPEGLRGDLLRLHAMAHSIINGASMATEGGAHGMPPWQFVLWSSFSRMIFRSDRIFTYPGLGPPTLLRSPPG